MATIAPSCRRCSCSVPLPPTRFSTIPALRLSQLVCRRHFLENRIPAARPNAAVYGRVLRSGITSRSGRGIWWLSRLAPPSTFLSGPPQWRGVSREGADTGRAGFPMSTRGSMDSIRIESGGITAKMVRDPGADPRWRFVTRPERRASFAVLTDDSGEISGVRRFGRRKSGVLPSSPTSSGPRPMRRFTLC